MSAESQFKHAEAEILRGWHPNMEIKIQEAEYRYGTVTCKKTYLDNLRFMGAPHDWYVQGTSQPKTEEGKIYSLITGTGGDETVSLRRVVSGIISIYGHNKADDSKAILYELGMANDWYKKFLVLGAYFDRRLVAPFCVRNWWDHQSLYLEDGNTRALVYALRLLCGEEEYKPIPIIWCRTWNHVLSWADINANELGDSPFEIDGIEWK